MILVTEEDKKQIQSEIKHRTISFSQISKYTNCPHAWKLKYIDKIILDSYSIHLLFGTAIHECFQEYLKVCYSKSGKAGDLLMFEDMLLEAMTKEFNKAVAQYNTKSFTTPEQINEFYKQGCELLNYLREERTMFFDLKKQELIGIEIPLVYKIPGYDITFIGYIDYGLKHKNVIETELTDLKTSFNGWYGDKKKDEITQAQLLLYKHFYSIQYNTPLENIKVNFLVTKRKSLVGIDTDGLYPSQLRKHQNIEVPSGSTKMKKALALLDKFLLAFETTGEVKPEFKFVQNKCEKSCQWCEYKNTKYCI